MLDRKHREICVSFLSALSEVRAGILENNPVKELSYLICPEISFHLTMGEGLIVGRDKRFVRLEIGLMPRFSHAFGFYADATVIDEFERSLELSMPH